VHWHPCVEITQLGRHGIEGRESRKIVLGSHTGTHIDAPLHFIERGTPIDKILLDQLVGPALVLQMGPVKPRQVFDVDDLKRRIGDKRPTRVIFHFGWSKHWGTADFYTQTPSITEAAAQYLIDLGVRVAAMDSPQLDHPDHGRGCALDSPIHKIMLSQGAVFVECCTNIGEIRKDEVQLMAMPLKILGSDGAPARIAAIES
jgi:kynurenine formamidase